MRWLGADLAPRMPIELPPPRRPAGVPCPSSQAGLITGLVTGPGVSGCVLRWSSEAYPTRDLQKVATNQVCWLPIGLGHKNSSAGEPMHQLVGDLGWTTPYARMREQVRGRWLGGRRCRGKNSRLLGREELGRVAAVPLTGPCCGASAERNSGADYRQFIIAPRSLRNDAESAILVTFVTNSGPRLTHAPGGPHGRSR